MSAGSGSLTPFRAPAWVVIAAGVAAALHVAKLAPALPIWRQEFGLSLAQAGWLLSTVQAAGMGLGALMGGVADAWGLRRCALSGLLLLSAASALAPAVDAVPALLALRALEGLGFLLATMPAAGLVRRHVPAQGLALMLGVWGCYMPLATALALLLGPWVLVHGSWAAWWWLAAAATAAMAGLLAWVVPADPTPDRGAAQTGQGWLVPLWARLRRTWSSPGPWLVATAFALYSGQWLAVIGFLPSMLSAEAWSPAQAAWLMAALAGVNMLGNLASGALQHRGVSPGRLLGLGFACMALGAWLAFQAFWPLSFELRMGGVLVFSLVGGVIPGTLFSQAVRVAPDEGCISTTVGWMQQCSSLGQFLGPPVVGALAAWSGGWQWTWVFTGVCSALGLGVAWALPRLRPH